MNQPPSTQSTSLWIAVTIAFLIIATAWGTFIFLSRQNPVEPITLETPARSAPAQSK